MAAFPSSLPPTMRAWTYTSRGLPEDVLQLSTFPTPDPSSLLANEVLVKISHVGIPQGAAVLIGILPHLTSTPWIACQDFSGTIVATGTSITHVIPGDLVFGSPDPKEFLTGKYNGVLVEYAILPGTAVVQKPKNITMASVAGIAGPGCPAIQFCELVRLKEGDSVLIIGASGGTGSLTVQVARRIVGKAGRVVGTCSAVNAELVRALGVDEVIDYKTQTVHEYLLRHYSAKPFDAIIDIAGSDERIFNHCPAYLKPDSLYLPVGDMRMSHNRPNFFGMLRFVFGRVLQSFWPAFLGGVPRKNFMYSGNVDHETMQKLAGLVEMGHVKGLVDSEWAMEDAIKAFQRVGTARARGQVVVRV